MKRTFFLLSCLLLTFFSVRSQEHQELKKFLAEVMYSNSNDKILTDSLKKNKMLFHFPRKNGDTLVSYVLRDFKNEMASLKKDCNARVKENEIITEYEVKSYVRGKILSILEKVYEYCDPMPSPAYYGNTYNYVLCDNHIYKISFKENNAKLNKMVDSIVRAHFNKECLEDVIIDGSFDLFIDKGLFINNPLHTKACDEIIEVKNAIDYLEFTKMK